MLKNKFLITLSLLTIFGYCNAANAATVENFEFDANTNKIEISGLCEGKNIIIEIFSSKGEKPLYSAGKKCDSGQYLFSDDLRYWQIPAGDYRAVVYNANDLPNNPPGEFKFSVEEPAPDADGSENSESNDSEQNIFEKILEWLQAVIVNLKELIAQKITTSELCVGATCINEEKLKEIINGGNEHDEEDSEKNSGENEAPTAEEDSLSIGDENTAQENGETAGNIRDEKHEENNDVNNEYSAPEGIDLPAGGNEAATNTNQTAEYEIGE